MNALKQARQRASLTQAQLAAAVGLTQAAIAHYETGRRAPGLAGCRSIVAALQAAGLDCSLENVFPPRLKEDAAA